MTAAQTVSVCIFAYNEERLITACLDSVLAESKLPVTVHVLANGCTDATVAVVGAYAARDPRVRPVVVRRGDKANAWNHYVHVVAPTADVHAFMDGDMRVAPGSIDRIAACMAAHPDANAVAGLPATGRSRVRFRRKLIDNHEIAGNLYALRDRALHAFRARGVRLPTGVFGEDGLIATLIKWDLDTLGPQHPERIVACDGAEFAFDPLRLASPRDWRIYRNRRMRYAVRFQQACMLYPLLFEKGVQAMPAHIVDLYRSHADKLEPRRNGIDAVFDLMAIHRIRRKIREGSGATETDEARLYS